MASLLSGIGTLYLLFAMVIISHVLQLGVVLMVGALVWGAVLLARPAGAADRIAATDDVPDAELPPAERLAVALAEEPSERVLAQRAAIPSQAEAERVLEPAGH